ncbi:D-aminoacyl-tRNA deacylase [Candidatus Spyradosoma sp. SGI.093]|uniref:D-aminoacyl-tRNA deacylase n=1 Tax=Candidatus Spyradosoma sp. SGI.093 TaxID=3420583 RepID=UPI003D094B74
MRAVVQRVKRASVSADGSVVGAIGKGMLILLGVEAGDTEADADWLATRLARVRIFEDADGKMNLAARDVGGSALVVSQFTLFGTMRKGSRPSFNRAAVPAEAIPLYESFTAKLSALLERPVPTGRFGAMMDVELVNDGPVTLTLDSRRPDF